MIDKQQFIQDTTALLPGLHRAAVSILRHPGDAEDAVQQALLKAWEKRESARPESFRAWLYRIVVNQCRDTQRRRMRVTPVESVPETPIYEKAYDPPDPALNEAIYALKESLRVPLLLRYMEEYPISEIASILNIPSTLVKNRLFRARRALEKALTHNREEERE